MKMNYPLVLKERILTRLDLPELFPLKLLGQEPIDIISREGFAELYNTADRYNLWLFSHLYKGRGYPEFGGVWGKRCSDEFKYSVSLEKFIGKDEFYFRKGDTFSLLSVLGSLLLFKVESPDVFKCGVSLMVIDIGNYYVLPRIEVPNELHFDNRLHVNFISHPQSSYGFKIVYVHFNTETPLVSIFNSITNEWELLMVPAIKVPDTSKLNPTDHRAMIVSNGGEFIHLLSFNEDNAPVFHPGFKAQLLVPAFITTQEPQQREDWIMRRSMHFSAGNDGLVVLMVRHIHPRYQEFSILDMLVVARIRGDWHHYEFVAALPPHILQRERPCYFDYDLGLQIKQTQQRHINIGMLVSTRPTTHPKPWGIRHLCYDPVKYHWSDSASLSHAHQDLDLPFFTSKLTLIPAPVRDLTRFASLFKGANTVWTFSQIFDSRNHPDYGYIWGMRHQDEEDAIRIPIQPILKNNGMIKLGDDLALLSVLGSLLLLKVKSLKDVVSLMVVDLLGSCYRVVTSIQVPNELHDFNYKPHVNLIPHPESPLGFKIVYIRFEDEKDIPMYSIFNSKTHLWELVSAEATLVPNNLNLDTTDHRSMIVSKGGDYVYLLSFNGDNLPVFQRHLMTELLVPALKTIQLPDPLETWIVKRTMHFSAGNDGLVVLMVRNAHPVFKEFSCLRMLVVARMRDDWQNHEFVAALPPRLLYDEVFIFDELQDMQVKQTDHHINIGMVVYTHRLRWGIRHITYDLVKEDWDNHESLFNDPHEIGLPFFTSKLAIALA